MLINKPTGILSSEITSEKDYQDRRSFLIGTAALSIGSITPGCRVKASEKGFGPPSTKLKNVKKSGFGKGLELTSWKDATSYNNFYEFSANKAAPAKMARGLQTDPWSVTVEGDVAKPAKLDLDAFLKPHPLEERIYRFRCVEAWSMVVPWVGIPLADVLKRFAPSSKAKFVEFTTLYDPKQMPRQNDKSFPWPYVEGLRMDEAMHPLTLLVVGLYGRILPNQNGAPLRLIVPWKYGFKSIKSIVKIRLTDKKPKTAWNIAAPEEYGFYANVNPTVPHPRWSQAYERRIGEFFKSHETKLFNGYAEQVAHLYKGMNLRVRF